MSAPRDVEATETLAPMDEEELVSFLERDQLVADKRHPVPRASLGAGATVALWVLRVFALVLSAMVIYTFAVQLTG